MEQARRNLQDSIDTVLDCGFTLEELEQAAQGVAGRNSRDTSGLNLLEMLALCVNNDMEAYAAKAVSYVFGNLGGVV